MAKFEEGVATENHLGNDLLHVIRSSEVNVRESRESTPDAGVCSL